MKKLYSTYSSKTILCLAFILFFQITNGAEIILFSSDAVVWLKNQTVEGKLEGFFNKQVTVFSNDKSFVIAVEKDSSFKFSLPVSETGNRIKVSADHADSTITSKEIFLRLGYHPLPVVEPYAEIHKNNITLHAKILSSNTAKPLKFKWFVDSQNPEVLKVKQSSKSVTTASLPSINGIYYFNLLVISENDSVVFKTYIEKDGNEITAFDMKSQHGKWIDDAIIYEITPSVFVKAGTYNSILEKLSELKKLGVNTLWLQPVFENSDRGQGYAVTNYFSLRPDLGTKEQLKQLIDSAKKLQMHVIFDFVPNHTSIFHPYAKDVIQKRTSSHYYNFYQHIDDGAPYSSYYNRDEYGFIFYFWKNLVNLNYQSKEVQQWMIEACKYWVREFDIDGFRFDAVWGVNARCPEFAERLKTELKCLKPDFLMLAEDKGSDEHVYKLGYDVAYDWRKDTSWVSHWSWQYKYDAKKSFTVFNFPDAQKRAEMLREQLFTNNGYNDRLLRFMENNDLPRFITDHGIQGTKMVAALLFSLPGIPMIYCGQEVGFESPVYSSKPIFSTDSSIQSSDKSGLFNYYAKLTHLRASFDALRSNKMHELSINPSSTMVAFTRESQQELFIIVLNLDSNSTNAMIDLRNYPTLIDKIKNYELKDVLSSDNFKLQNKFSISMKGYSTRWLLFEKKR